MSELQTMAVRYEAGNGGYKLKWELQASLQLSSERVWFTFVSTLITAVDAQSSQTHPLMSLEASVTRDGTPNPVTQYSFIAKHSPHGAGISGLFLDAGCSLRFTL